MTAHVGRVTRRFRNGVWNTAAACVCGWWDWAASDWEAKRKAKAHCDAWDAS